MQALISNAMAQNRCDLHVLTMIMFQASKLSYVLGKHEWEVTGDVFECNAGLTYTTHLKVVEQCMNHVG